MGEKTGEKDVERHVHQHLSEESYGEKIWSRIIRAVMEHYRIQWRFLHVEFRAKFCSRPWLWMSVFVATIILLLTLLQTIYALLDFYWNILILILIPCFHGEAHWIFEPNLLHTEKLIVEYHMVFSSYTRILLSMFTVFLLFSMIRYTSCYCIFISLMG